jgi:hypothetical protein
MLPPAIIRSLRIPRLTAADFTPTKFHTAEDKAWFANTLLKFLADDCPRSGFTVRLYVRLSNSFGHIAHYDRSNFFEHFFPGSCSSKRPCIGPVMAPRNLHFATSRCSSNRGSRRRIFSRSSRRSATVTALVESANCSNV